MTFTLCFMLFVTHVNACLWSFRLPQPSDHVLTSLKAGGSVFHTLFVPKRAFFTLHTVFQVVCYTFFVRTKKASETRFAPPLMARVTGLGTTVILGKATEVVFAPGKVRVSLTETNSGFRGCSSPIVDQSSFSSGLVSLHSVIAKRSEAIYFT